MKKSFKKKSLLFIVSAMMIAQPAANSFANEAYVGGNIPGPIVGPTYDEFGNSQENYLQVNSYLKTLNYDSEDLLTVDGQTITNKFPTTGKFKNGEFVVVEKIKKKINSKNADIAIMTSNSDRIYAGALLKANRGLLENNPTLISLERAPMNVSIDLPGMVNGDSSEEVITPSNSSVRTALNNLTNRWHEKYSEKYPNVPAKLEYNESMVKSENQLRAQLGMNFEKIGVPLKFDFGSIVEGEKQACVVNLKQVYYNVSIDAPSQPAKFFAPTVTKDDLITAGVDANTPPVYISNIAYGRAMYIKLETTSKSYQAHAAFEALIKGVELNSDNEFKRILDNTTFTAVILGGSPDGSTKIINGKAEDLKKLIAEGNSYNRNNLGVPISYRTSFVKDNAPATFQNNSDYVETKITSFRDGELVLTHKGAYIAKFFVNWEEVSYDENGREIREKKSWEDNGKGRTAGFSVAIPLKGNVRNLDVKIIEKTGLVWEKWRTVYNKKDIQLVKNREITIWGTTLHPRSADIVNND